MKRSKTTTIRLMLLGPFIGLFWLICCQSGQHTTPPSGSGQLQKKNEWAPGEANTEIIDAQSASVGRLMTPSPIIAKKMFKEAIGEYIPRSKCKAVCNNKKMIQKAMECKIAKERTIQSTIRECVHECKLRRIGTNTLECFEKYTDCQELKKCARAPSPEDYDISIDPVSQNQGSTDGLMKPPSLPSEELESPLEPKDTAPNALEPAAQPPSNQGEVEPKADSNIE